MESADDEDQTEGYRFLPDQTSDARDSDSGSSKVRMTG